MPRRSNPQRKPQGGKTKYTPRIPKHQDLRPANIYAVAPPDDYHSKIVEPPLTNLGVYASVDNDYALAASIKDYFDKYNLAFRPLRHLAALILSPREVRETQETVTEKGRPFAENYKAFVERSVKGASMLTGVLRLGNVVSLPHPNIPHSEDTVIGFQLDAVPDRTSHATILRRSLVKPLRAHLQEVGERPDRINERLGDPRLLLPVGIIESKSVDCIPYGDQRWTGSSIGNEGVIGLGSVVLAEQWNSVAPQRNMPPAR